MEASSSSMKRKRKKARQEKQEDSDIISKLPKVLVEHIFSLLPTKDVVRASILSKKYEYMWTSVPNLEFDECKDINNFMNFVDRAISLRRSSIKQFYISNFQKLDQFRVRSWSTSQKLDPFRVRRWITAVVNHDVEDLRVDMGSEDEDSFEFPHCLFASTSLASLSLHLNWKFEFPQSTCLSCLKHLNLEYIRFPTGESTKSFFGGSPLLETMRLVECQVYFPICICLPKLWKLEIIDGIDNEEFWSDRWSDSRQVKFFVPSLNWFHYNGVFLIEHCLSGVTSLEEGKIEFDHNDFVEGFGDFLVNRLYKLLEGVSSTKKLLLSYGAIEVLKEARDRLPNIPVFNNLSTLIFYSGTRYDPLQLDCEVVMKILQNSACVETLRFEMGVTVSSDSMEIERILDPVPPCFQSSLKRIEIFFKLYYSKRKLFLAAVEILLKRAIVLDKLVVCICSEYPKYGRHEYDEYDAEAKKENLIKKLTQIPRASMVCQLEFSEKL